MKPVKKEEFDDAFFRALKKYRKNNNDLVFKWGNERYRVQIDDFLFVEGYHRHIVVHTFDRKFESVGKLTEMYDYLRSFSFVRIHQGYRETKQPCIFHTGSRLADFVTK